MESFAAAQADTAGAAAPGEPMRIIKVRKPHNEQPITVELGHDQHYKLDLSAIADEKITLVQLGEKLIILFDNKSAVTVEPFFNSAPAPLPNITVEATGRDFTSSEFAAYFPIAPDQSVLTAAGDTGANGSPSSGANFRGTSVDPLSVPKPLDLLGQEELPNFVVGPHPFGAPHSGGIGLGGAPAASAPTASPNSDADDREALIAPTLSPAASVVHDETPGLQSAADPNAADDIAGGSLPAAILALFNAVGTARGDDIDVAAKDHAAIGFAANGDSIALTDDGGNPASVEYSLSVTDGTYSGTSTTAGTQVFLYTGAGPTAGLILGRVGSENGATDIADSNGAVAFALALDPLTGKGYTAQYLSLHHPDAGSAAGAHDEPLFLAAGAVQLRVTYGDGLGNFATSAALDISQAFGFQDDGPVAGAVTKTISTAGHDTNIMLILDVSGSMASQSGIVGLTRLDVMKAAVAELLEQYGHLGAVRVQIVAFSSSASQVGTDWMTVEQAKAAVSNLGAAGSTNYDAAVNLAQSIFANAGKLATAGVQNVSYFMSDGAPNQPPGSAGINAAEESAWTGFLAANAVNSFALGMGTTITQSALDPLAFNGQSGADTGAIIVTDLAQLAPALAGTVETASGNLLTDGVLPGTYGADGGHVKSITVDGTSYIYDPVAVAVTVSGADHGTFDPATRELTVMLASGTVLTVNMNDGTFRYTGPAGLSGAFTDVIPFELADGDGDTAGNTLTLVYDQPDHPPIVRDDHVITNVLGGSGTSITIPDYALLFNDSDFEGQAISVSAVSNVAGATSVAQMSGAAIFVDDASAGGSFTYAGATSTGSDTGDVIVDRGQRGTTLSGTGFGEILIGRDDAANVIKANAGDDVLIGGNLVDTLNGGAGNDLLAGGGGADVLAGGAGADRFRINASSEGVDNIVDFNAADGDVVEILGTAFGGLSPGALAPDLFVANAGGIFTDGTQRFSFDAAGKMLYYDSDGSGAAARIALAHFENGTNLIGTEIYVV